MALNPVMALSATSAIVAFVNFGVTLMGRAYVMHSSSDGGGEVVSLGSGKLIPVLWALTERLERRFKTSVGCLTRDENDIEDLRIVSCKLAGDLLIRLERIRDVEGETRALSSREDSLRKAWVEEDLDSLHRRLSAFKVQIEAKIVPFLKNIINVSALSETERFDALDLDVKDMVEMLLENLVMFPELTELQSRAGALDRNMDLDEQDPAATLEAFDATVEPETQKPRISPWDPAKDASSDKASLLQDFMLENLSYASMRDREEEVAEAHRKTFEWIFESEDWENRATNFPKWLRDGDNGIYWINGKAGSGKSTLMRFIHDHRKTVEDLQIWAGAKPLTVAGFFFWTSGSYEQRSQVGLLRYLLFQLLQQHKSFIPLVFPDLWKQFWIASTKDRIKASTSWSLQSLIHGLRLFFRYGSGKMKIFLLVDGLDEFDGDHGEIIHLFKSIVGSSNNDIKVCVSSRPWVVFEEAFNAIPTLKLQDLTVSDMNQYVEDKFNKNPRIRRIVRKDPVAGQSLMDEIVSRADGVFLWVILVVRSLLEDIHAEDRVADLRERLCALPRDLDGLFQHTLFDTQSEEHVRVASRIFQLIRAREIVCDFTRDLSAASLTLWELALAYDKDIDLALQLPIQQASYQDVSSRCRDMAGQKLNRCVGLLDIHWKGPGNAGRARFAEEDSGGSAQLLAQGRVTYLHRTIRDFLIYSGVWSEVVGKTRFEEFDPHLRLLKSYVVQLKLPLEEPERHRRLDEWWPDIVLALTHARYASNDPKSDMLVPLISELDTILRWYWLPKKTDPNDNWARSAFGSYEARNKKVYHDPFLSLTTKFGLCRYVDSQLPRTYKGGQPLLSYAIEFLISRRHTIYPLSSPLLVSTILHNGADPNQSYTALSPRRETTPWLEALECLREAHRRGWMEYYCIDPEKAARWVQILRLFLEYGADPNAEIKESGWDPAATALEIVGTIFGVYGAAEVGELRDLLVQKGAMTRVDAKGLENAS